MQRHSKTPQLAWDDVRFFLALCRSRTLSEGARRFGVDASTMSRRLGALEAAMNATLFERGREGVLATETALQLQPVAEEMEHVMARFSGTLESFERNVSGRVRLACPGDVAEILIAPLLPKLLERHPELRIDLAAGEGILDMARREADIALRTIRPTAGDLIVTRLFSVGWRVAAAPSVARRLGALRSWTDVPWVGCGPRLAETTPGRWLSSTAPKAEPVVRGESLNLQLACVRTGLGAALVPERSIEASGLVPLRLHGSLEKTRPAWPQDDFLMVTHRSLRRVPRIKAVWDFLLEEAVPHKTADK